MRELTKNELRSRWADAARDRDRWREVAITEKSLRENCEHRLDQAETKIAKLKAEIEEMRRLPKEDWERRDRSAGIPG